MTEFDEAAVEILLVEDNARDVDLTLRAFRRHNLANAIHVVEDGAEAIAYLFGDSEEADAPLVHRPKLVLLDLHLPKVGGLEVLRRIKASAEGRLIPVVVLTASTQETDMVESYQLGVNSYIQKPVDFAQFLECVRKLGFYWLLLNSAPD